MWTRLLELWDRFSAESRRRWWLYPLVLVATVVFQARLAQAADSVVAAMDASGLVADAVRGLIGPIGLLAVVVAIILILSYWETRPPKSHSARPIASNALTPSPAVPDPGPKIPDPPSPDAHPTPVPSTPDPRFHLSLHANEGGVFIRVYNDGPKGAFRGEVLSITGSHFDPESEQSNWPWPVRWGARTEDAMEIETGKRGDLQVVLFDPVGALSQLSYRGGFAFRFPAPGRHQHGIRGRIGKITMAELKAERLFVTLHVIRLGEQPAALKGTVGFTFQGSADWSHPPAPDTL